jgi:hypothetical protein
VKIILAGVAFATLMASPLFAQRQAHEGSVHSRAYSKQKSNYEPTAAALTGCAEPRLPHAESEPDPVQQGLCTTAPGFCPGYHGSNGG